jgi:5-methylthioadenosine/S-adenosylhomocysteine deaminase
VTEQHLSVVAALLAAAIAVTSAVVPAATQAADLAITNIDYIDVEASKIVKGGLIVVRDGKIVHAGPAGVPLPSGVQIIDGADFVALPGFVNAHTHLWQHVAKGLKPAGNLQTWAPLVHQFLHYCTPDEMYGVTLAAAGEALLSGVTTTSDFASPYSEFILDQTSAAMKAAGIDGIVVYWNPAVFLPPGVKTKRSSVWPPMSRRCSSGSHRAMRSCSSRRSFTKASTWQGRCILG